MVVHQSDDSAVDIHLCMCVGGKYITYTPVEQALDKPAVQQMLDKQQIAIPTLIMMQHIVELGRLLGKPWTYPVANDSVALMYEIGVPILVGTDAAKPFGGLVLYGASIYKETGLLACAGLSNEVILRGATSLTAGYFNLRDRGVIEPGMRADLLLLGKDPLVDIENSDKIAQVWTAGTPVNGSLGARARARAPLCK